MISGFFWWIEISNKHNLCEIIILILYKYNWIHYKYLANEKSFIIYQIDKKKSGICSLSFYI